MINITVMFPVGNVISHAWTEVYLFEIPLRVTEREEEHWVQ